MLKIVTDSTSDLPPKLAQELDIAVVPLYVHFGQEVFRDGIDIAADDFYRRQASTPVFPTTSAPGPGVFAEAYKGLVDQGHQVISIHISSKLSATYQAAVTASQDFDSSKVTVIDSQTISLGLGLMTLAVARAAAEGQSLEQVVAQVEQTIPRVRTVFVLDTLEYLQKGGRIGRAQAFMGSLLNVKPILHVKDGEIHPLERSRSRAKALNRVYELVSARSPLEALGVVYSTTPEEAKEMADRLADLAPDREVFLAQVGPVLGAHSGYGVLGVATIRAEI
ncbi:MAG: DegV family protein [Dehalococcoidia bacterium]|jgi:DegV family protein with EDD domain|nr:DegV family protein [Dehalococcoidia bacterium]MDP7240124.1 DegV family protein [Dehalococcoidia bacterium]MDP7470418.1 DegV family protein [Dehalococcoidia bacterium]